MENKKEERKITALRVTATVLANLTAILSANYIVFYILDHVMQNHHFVVRTEFFFAKYLHFAIPILIQLTAIAYLLLLINDGFSRRRLTLRRFLLLIAADTVIATVIAVTISGYTFDWFRLRANDQHIQVEEMQEKPEHIGEGFRDRFTDGQPVETEPNTVTVSEDGVEKTLVYTYKGYEVAIEITRYKTEELEYQIADLYVRDIRNLIAGYVNSSGSAQKLYEFARQNRAMIAINTDNFAYNAIDEGLIIRNGYLIRDNPCKYSDLCVIYQDGQVECFDCKTDEIDTEAIMKKYPYQSFYFGPSLLDKDGHAKTVFNSEISGADPRSVFGYYEPGHYAFITVLGSGTMKDMEGKSESSKSLGITFEDLSKLCESLKLKAAYNLEGGRATGMYWKETLYGHNNRSVGDILAVVGR